ncbi:DNA-3-methyladenine glycosylase [Nakamurella aerolata]|uniref:DNA-3-methyladenine glycosylase n=1 Tax=Nakamurella aerolata TaxID=1656892 RepID=UPI0031B59980
MPRRAEPSQGAVPHQNLEQHPDQTRDHTTDQPKDQRKDQPVVRASEPLQRDLLAERADVAAPRLLGALITAGSGERRIAIRLTEVEAYLGPDDPASHAFRRTPRSAVMYGPPGHLYVYFSYGMHWCANLVTGPDESASAVLLRAGAVVAGAELAAQRRPVGTKPWALARGPANLAAVLGVTGADSGADLFAPASPVRLLSGEPAAEIAVGPRVGISKAADLPLRFWIPDEPSVTPYRRSPRAPAAGPQHPRA